MEKAIEVQSIKKVYGEVRSCIVNRGRVQWFTDYLIDKIRVEENYRWVKVYYYDSPKWLESSMDDKGRVFEVLLDSLPLVVSLA